MDKIDKDLLWMISELDSSLLLKVSYYDKDGKQNVSSYNVLDILNIAGEEINVKFSNISDIVDFLTIGMIRFYDYNDNSKTIDIPLRKLYLIFDKACIVSKNVSSNSDIIKFSELDGFVNSRDIEVTDIVSLAVDDISDEFRRIISIAKDYGSMGMDEQYNAITEVNNILSKKRNDYENGKLYK